MKLKIKNLVFFILLTFPFKVFAQDIIDLSYSFDENTVYWPSGPGFKLEKHGWTVTEKGYFYAGNSFCAPEHGGTHIDAPIHFSQGKWTVDQIPLHRFIGKAFVIDLSQKVLNQASYLISENDIINWEQDHESLGPDSIVLFRTGWSRFWSHKKKYLGSDAPGDTTHLDFPGIGEDAARYLVSKKIKGVGIDTASLDQGRSAYFKSHQILLGANIYGLENVANIDRVPSTGYQLIVAPMKITQGTGGPVRIFAIKE